MKRDDPRMQAKRARRIVVKVGSSTLTRNGTLRSRKFSELAEQITALANQRRLPDHLVEAPRPHSFGERSD